MEAVASSNTKIRGSARIARAKDKSCFSPVDNIPPPSPTSLSKPLSIFSITNVADTSSNARMISSSVASGLP